MIGHCDICGEEHELDLNGGVMMIGKRTDAEQFARLHGLTLRDPSDLPKNEPKQLSLFQAGVESPLDKISAESLIRP